VWVGVVWVVGVERGKGEGERGGGGGGEGRWNSNKDKKPDETHKLSHYTLS